MKRKPWASIAAVLAGILGTNSYCGHARAQTPAAASFDKLDVNEDGVLSGSEMRSVAARDADGDGRVTKDEFAGRPEGGPRGEGTGTAADDEKLFARRDITEDGVLSGTEVKGFEALDADGDRELTKAEFLAGRAAARRGRPGPAPAPGRGGGGVAGESAAAKIRAEAMFRAADGNDDGRLSGTEIQFDAKSFDADGDGRITRDEFVAVQTAKQDTPHEAASAGLALLTEAIKSGDAGPFYAVMREELRREIDERVLQWVFAAVHDEYGQVAKLEKLTTKESKTEGKPYELLAEVSFAQGTDRGELKVVVYDGLVLGFRLQTPLADRIDQVLYGKLATDKEFAVEVGEHFADRGKELFTRMFAGKDAEAHGMFHSEFQAKVPLETMKQYFDEFRDQAGKIESVEWSAVTCKFGEGGKPENRFSVDYEIEAENGKFTGHARFEFAGFQAALVGIGFEKAK